MSDLDELFGRLTWTTEEIDRLEQEVERYTQSEPIEIYQVVSFTRGSRTRLYRSRLRAEVPLGVRAHSGTIINELRAVLDGLAVCLAARNNRPDSRSTAFPTATSEARFSDRRVTDKIRHLSEADRKAIKALKPWLGGNDVLYALHSSDIIRKHQRLLVMAGDVASTTLAPDKPFILNADKLFFLNGGGEIGSTHAETHIDVILPLRLNAVVAFAEPELIKSKPLIPTLREFWSVVDTILKVFS